MRSGSETASTPTSTVTDPRLSMIRRVYPRTPNGCEECLVLGTEWVHLRLCPPGGQVGCCDSSPLRHARAHAHSAGHPIVRPADPRKERHNDSRYVVGQRRRARPGQQALGWMMVFGIISLLAGVAVLAWPGRTLIVVAVLFGIQLVVTGIFRFVAAFASEDLTGGTREITLAIRARSGRRRIEDRALHAV